LLDLGLTDVTDLEGGFQAWRRLDRQPESRQPESREPERDTP
jgi:3-mercaptopyruvate sulfurtransferase SseA